MNNNLNPNIRGLKKSATLAINERSKALAAQGKQIYKLGFGQSPFPVPMPVVEGLKEFAHTKDYLDVRGLLPLRKAISAYYQRKHQISCRAENIQIGPGSKELLFILQLVFDGDLLIPNPSWVSYSPQALMVGKKVVWLSTKSANNWMLTAEELEAICQKDPKRPRILILNYPSNPTGASYSRKQLQEMATVAQKYKVILLSDEIYGELNHTDQHLSIAHYYPEGTIISSGLSKWCGAGGWRLGFFIFPDQLSWIIDAMSIVASETFTSTSAPIQYAAIAAFEENPEIDQYLLDAQRILRFIGETIHSKLNSHQINSPKPQGGFYLFPDFSAYQSKLADQGITNSTQLCEQLLENTGVALLPSYDFGRPSDELTARLSYVDFDGAKALKLAQTTYQNKDLDQTFLDICCCEMLEAINKILVWLNDRIQKIC